MKHLTRFHDHRSLFPSFRQYGGTKDAGGTSNPRFMNRAEPFQVAIVILLRI